MLFPLSAKLPGKTAAELLRGGPYGIALWCNQRKEKIMASYVGLIQFADQGIRNIKDTVKRGDAAMAEAEKMGMKVVEEFWTMGAYDAVVLFDAPDDETMSAFMLKIGSLGNVKSQTMRAFRRNEMEEVLAKIK